MNILFYFVCRTSEDGTIEPRTPPVDVEDPSQLTPCKNPGATLSAAFGQIAHEDW